MRTKKVAHKIQSSQQYDEEEIIPNEGSEIITDATLATKLFEEDNYEYILKDNAHVLEGLDLFIKSKYSNKIFLNCKNDELSSVIAEIYKQKTNHTTSIINALDIIDIEDTIRRNINIRAKTTVDVYEGEITDIKIQKNEANEIEDIEIRLKSMKGSKTVKVCKYLYNYITTLNIGDVVYAESNAGLIRRLGRSENRMNEYDLEGDRYIQINKSSVHSRREKESLFTLYDMDYAFNNYKNNISFLIREKVENSLFEYVQKGLSTLIEGSIVIQGCHNLNAKQLCILKKYIDECAWIKFVLLGDKDKIVENCTLEMLSLSINHFDGYLETLGLKHKKIQDPRFSEVVKMYLKKENLNIISDALYLSETPEDFVKIMKTQIGTEN